MPHLTLPSANIGPYRFSPLVAQAALSGYSDRAMRVMARRMGAAYALCEVVLDRIVLNAGRKLERRLFEPADEERPVGGQLMGSDPDEFGPAAKRLVEWGFDVVDINFGCPVKKVLGRCRGGFHLSQPNVALEIVGRVRDAVPAEVPMTVKMRRGIDDSQESRDWFFEILDGAFELGAAAITVHGRTVKQRYDGPSRWEFLSEVKRHVGNRTILGSGDLFTAADCLRMFAETGVDGITVARGAIGNPWIFHEIQALTAGQPLPDPPSLFEQRDVLYEHYRLAEEIYGPRHCCRQMRKFGIRYSELHPEGTAVRDAFVAVKEPGGWQAVLREWYAQDLPGKRPSTVVRANGQKSPQPQAAGAA